MAAKGRRAKKTAKKVQPKTVPGACGSKSCGNRPALEDPKKAHKCARCRTEKL